ncbi:hypothetical protein [Kitasatospora sp. CB01950]|uniref:hypothetical protein n=1 Tax=Kitasatospora sp. CB01950 TaxID=1703930 RepID=UPI00093AD28F|nr:hypothetical protein [Kitasatospora sp. CB01950]OKJ13799.1 hypothetical protein AMK19_10355 [Kitasatospora sp. CB01950]
MTARSGRNEKDGRDSDDGLSLESLIEEHRPRRIFRIGGGASEPEQGPEGGSGTAQSEPDTSAAPENGGPEGR